MRDTNIFYHSIHTLFAKSLEDYASLRRLVRESDPIASRHADFSGYPL